LVEYSYDGVSNRPQLKLDGIVHTTRAEGKEFWRYNWDYENRLVSASTRKQTVRYKYDALGRRIQRIVGNGRENTKFVYDGQDVVMDDNSGTLTKYQNGLGIDNKLKLSSNGVSKYFIADHLGSTNALTDTSGAILEQTAYDSFGNATNQLSTRYAFTGREYDDFTGLHYYRARFYDARLGRFISEDPIGFEGNDVNLFVYVHNNPLNYFDPEGTQVRADSRWEPWPREENTKMVTKIRSMPNPEITDRWERLVACHERYKFSTLGGIVPYGQETLEILETGSVLSIGSDVVATGIKAGGTTFSKPQPYASGINMILRRTNRVLGQRKIGGFYPYRYLRPLGDKATRGFLLFGAFTFSYNTTVDIQCICGVLE